VPSSLGIRPRANKSNRLMLEQLARRGHECHAVAPLSGQVSTVALDDLPDYLAQRGARILDRDQHVITYEHRGVVVHGAVRASDLARTLLDVAEAVTPDWALVTNDDPAMMMLSAALRRVGFSLARRSSRARMDRSVRGRPGRLGREAVAWRRAMRSRCQRSTTVADQYPVLGQERPGHTVHPLRRRRGRHRGTWMSSGVVLCRTC
jgi:hypothetical protein